MPFKLKNDLFLRGAESIRSARDGASHRILPAVARGHANTWKFEVPEMRNIANPLLRIRWVGDDLTYEVFGDTDPEGAVIWHALLQGRQSTPEETHATRKDAQHATMWRFY